MTAQAAKPSLNDFDFESVLQLLEEAHTLQLEIPYNEPPAYPRPVAFLQVAVLVERAVHEVVFAEGVGVEVDDIMEEAVTLMRAVATEHPMHAHTLHYHHLDLMTLVMKRELQRHGGKKVAQELMTTIEKKSSHIVGPDGFPLADKKTCWQFEVARKISLAFRQRD